jgi:Zn-dependent protease with chaperone function
LLLLSYIALVGEWIAVKLFLVIDRYVGRQMELRADEVATGLVGLEVGVQTLSSLSAGIQPSLGGLFATHPASNTRIEQLIDKFSDKTANQET